MARSYTPFTVQPWDDYPYWMGDRQIAEPSACVSVDPYGTTEASLRQFAPFQFDLRQEAQAAPVASSVVYLPLATLRQQMERSGPTLPDMLRALAHYPGLLRWFAADCVLHWCQKEREWACGDVDVNDVAEAIKEYIMGERPMLDLYALRMQVSASVDEETNANTLALADKLHQAMSMADMEGVAWACADFAFGASGHKQAAHKLLTLCEQWDEPNNGTDAPASSLINLAFY